MTERQNYGMSIRANNYKFSLGILTTSTVLHFRLTVNISLLPAKMTQHAYGTLQQDKRYEFSRDTLFF